MAKRLILMLVVVGLVLGGVFGFEAFRSVMIKKFLAAHGAPPQTVSTMKAVEDEWQQQINAVGSLRAMSVADLSPQVAGTVSAIHFKSGTDVKAGTLLVELMAADDIAKLKSLQANAALAKITYERDLRQLKAQAVSQQSVDVDEQNLKSDLAQVAQQQAAVNYKFIRAPFDGHLGAPGRVDVARAAGDDLVVLLHVRRELERELEVGDQGQQGGGALLERALLAVVGEQLVPARMKRRVAGRPPREHRDGGGRERGERGDGALERDAGQRREAAAVDDAPGRRRDVRLAQRPRPAARRVDGGVAQFDGAAHHVAELVAAPAQRRFERGADDEVVAQRQRAPPHDDGDPHEGGDGHERDEREAERRRIGKRAHEHERCGEAGREPRRRAEQRLERGERGQASTRRRQDAVERGAVGAHGGRRFDVRLRCDGRLRFSHSLAGLDL